MNQPLFSAPNNLNCIRIIPLGGCGEFGMNLTAYLYDKRLFIVDCGVRFPDPTKLGIEAILPKVDDFFEQMGGVTAYVITHGHEDHLGALPYIVPRWPAPIYATPWTAELIRNKFERRGLDNDVYKVTEVEAGDKIATDGIEFQYVHVNHSIPMSCALVIRTKSLRIFHSGDFKFEETPVLEAPADFGHLAAIGDEGVDLLLADSTNAERQGACPSESSVRGPLHGVFSRAKGVIFFATFSSNFWRLKTAVDICKELGRRIYLAGHGVETTFEIARRCGLFGAEPDLFIGEDELSSIPRRQLAVFATGSQGEWRSSLMRLALGEYRAIKVEPGDTVVLSSRIIPGNERPILMMTDKLKRAGAHVVTTKDEPGIHVSGHAYGGDLDRLQELLRPRTFLPVHGAFSQMKANLDRALDEGSLTHKAHLIDSGDVIDLTPDGIKVQGTLEVELCYVDGESRALLNYEDLRQRLRIGELGGAFLTGIVSKGRREWVSPPEIFLQGVRLPQNIDEEKWMERASERVVRDVGRLLNQGCFDEAELSEEARVNLRRVLGDALGKRPVVIAKIHVV